ncbi:MAG: flagellar export chaperone FlgN [Bacillota bacterium]|nr:flagellar export chaperone FlgN [Bacillota bacterium]
MSGRGETGRWEELRSALEAERRACRRLGASAKRLQAALTAARMADVEAALRQQDEVLQELERSRRRRRAAQQRVALAAGLPPESSLAAVLPALPAPEAERLAGLRRDIEEEVERISRANDTTMRLIESFGRYVRFLRDVLQRNEVVSAYTPEGRPVEPSLRAAARSLSRYR